MEEAREEAESRDEDRRRCPRLERGRRSRPRVAEPERGVVSPLGLPLPKPPRPLRERLCVCLAASRECRLAVCGRGTSTFGDGARVRLLLRLRLRVAEADRKLSRSLDAERARRSLASFASC